MVCPALIPLMLSDEIQITFRQFFATQTEMSTFFAKKLEKFEKQARTKIKEIKKEDYK